MKHLESTFSQIRLYLRNKCGTAAIEFAVVLPLLLFLFVGMVELTTALSYDRRVSKTGASIADLVARSSDVTAEMDDIETAIDHQMSPFDNTDVNVQIGMILIVAKVPTVVWSWQSNSATAPWARGSIPEGVSFAPSMLVNGQFYVISTSTVTYDFLLGSLLSDLSEYMTGESNDFASISLGDSFVLHPRKVSCVEYYNNCANGPP
ncbi:TadE/TadG family type IV pilus assembly protein [Pseudovibrio ascidiaceicola]|uniref:TadE/TadG family type IV pilus assembly protein n=1 Tax=Pseudovibrio ascidiaceicola TaxID=285279 RepID=UPI000D69E8B7|nr:TadE/TadG family type IV pilus assembly protein [Pseudovibrio ascidiaceicola]